MVPCGDRDNIEVEQNHWYLQSAIDWAVYTADYRDRRRFECNVEFVGYLPREVRGKL